MFYYNKECLCFNLVENKKFKMYVFFELFMEMGTMLVEKKEEKLVMN